MRPRDRPGFSKPSLQMLNGEVLTGDRTTESSAHRSPTVFVATCVRAFCVDGPGTEAAPGRQSDNRPSAARRMAVERRRGFSSAFDFGRCTQDAR